MTSFLFYVYGGEDTIDDGEGDNNLDVLVGLLFSTRLYFMRVVTSDDVVAWHCIYEKKVTVDNTTVVPLYQQILLLLPRMGR